MPSDKESGETEQYVPEPREAHCKCCGGYAGYGRDPEYCAHCRRAGEHLRRCPMCGEDVPVWSFDGFCSDCSETIEELDRYAESWGESDE